MTIFLLHLLLMAATLDAQTVHSTRSRYVNHGTKEINWSVGKNRMVTGLFSYYDNRAEDRVWKFYYGYAPGIQCKSHYWTSVDDSDMLNAKCSQNEAVSGFKSSHDNPNEGPKWKLQCCKVTDVRLKDMGLTHYLNNWNRMVNYKCRSNEVLTGIYSVYSKTRNDRKYKVRCARLIPIHKVSVTSSWSGYQNNWGKHMHFTAGANKMITGFYSVHDNRSEDRRWRFYSGNSREVQCQPQRWSDWKNDMEGVLRLDCPANQVLYGIESYHDDRWEDRRWKLQCCRVSSNVLVQRKGITDYLNNWNGVLQWWCPEADQVVVSLNSYHSNHHEDRRWRAQCAQLTTK